MKNLVIRAMSGAIYVALMVVSILWLEQGNATLFLAFFALLIIVGVDEAERLLYGGEQPWPLRLLDKIGALSLFCTLSMCGTGDSVAAWMMSPVITYFVVRLCVQLFLPRVNALRSLSASFFAVVYLAMPLGLVVPIMSMGFQHVVLAVLVLIWLNDTGAYLVGSTCGRRRLFERISPKKSWEGFVGGVACCLIAAAVAWACQVAPREFFGLASWLVLAATVSIVATLGDLLESLLKRTAGVKDSGNLIPGHGGVLDRIDSLLMVLPAVYVLFSLISML